MDQKNLAFVPHVLPVVVGTTVDFLNSDQVLHNVFTPDKCAGKFNLGTWPKGETRSVKFDQTGCSPVMLCNVHPEMEGFVVVLQNPYAGVTDKTRDVLDPQRSRGQVHGQGVEPEVPRRDQPTVTVPKTGDAKCDLAPEVAPPPGTGAVQDGSGGRDWQSSVHRAPHGPRGAPDVAMVVVAGACSVCFAWAGCARSTRQPIAFNHRLHVYNNVPCLVCHASAASGQGAGLPGVAVCRRCHEDVLYESPEKAKIRVAAASGHDLALAAGLRAQAVRLLLAPAPRHAGQARVPRLPRRRGRCSSRALRAGTAAVRWPRGHGRLHHLPRRKPQRLRGRGLRELPPMKTRGVAR